MQLVTRQPEPPPGLDEFDVLAWLTNPTMCVRAREANKEINLDKS